MFTDKQLLGFGILALVIASVVRALNSDLPGPSISARWRPVVAAVLGQIGGLLGAVFMGVPIKMAVAGGLAASGLASLGHGFMKKTVMGGEKKDDGGGPNVAGVLLFIAVGCVVSATPFAICCSPSKPIVSPNPDGADCLAERVKRQLACVQDNKTDEAIIACREKVKAEVKCTTEAGVETYVTSREGGK